MHPDGGVVQPVPGAGGDQAEAADQQRPPALPPQLRVALPLQTKHRVKSVGAIVRDVARRGSG